jgi:hypothetical protein
MASGGAVFTGAEGSQADRPAAINTAATHAFAGVAPFHTTPDFVIALLT